MSLCHHSVSWSPVGHHPKVEGVRVASHPCREELGEAGSSRLAPGPAPAWHRMAPGTRGSWEPGPDQGPGPSQLRGPDLPL